MTLVLQLTPWALPALLALLLVAREWAFLFPRRRERGSVSLLVLTGLGAAWCFARFLLLLSSGPEVQARLLQLEFVAAALTPLAWLWFCLVLARRTRLLLSAPTAVLTALSLGTVFLAARAPEGTLLIEDLTTRSGAGYPELLLSPGPWYWVHLGLRGIAVIWGAIVATRYLSEGDAGRIRTLVPGAAALAALLPVGPQLAEVTFPVSRDLSPASITIVATLMVWSLLRQSLLKVGPVAHTLIMEELEDPLVVLDANGRIVDVNHRAEALLGLRAYGDVPLALGTLWASVRERAGRYARVTLPVNAPDGIPAADEEGDPRPRRVFEVTLTPLSGEAGSGQTALLLRDITERDRMEQELRETTHALRSANEELEKRANTDGLTGLANRRHFMDRLDSELDRSLRYQRPLSLVLLDLDHFKEVNDSHGHAAGDAVLRATADILRAVSRDVDLAGRIGGEEFGLLLPETPEEGAMALAERVRTRLAQRVYNAGEEGSYRVTGSLGVATRRGAQQLSGDSFLHRADTALYQAKDEGRNRVVSDGNQPESLPDLFEDVP